MDSKQSLDSIGALYGDTMYWLSEHHYKIPNTKSNPAYRMPFCHQSVFVKTSLLKQHHFDTSFKICADNAFFTTIYHQNIRFCYIDMIVSVYNAYGISSKPSWQFFKEELCIIMRHRKPYALVFFWKYLCMLTKYSIKSILPESWRLNIQSRYNVKSHI